MRIIGSLIESKTRGSICPMCSCNSRNRGRNYALNHVSKTLLHLLPILYNDYSSLQNGCSLLNNYVLILHPLALVKRLSPCWG